MQQRFYTTKTHRRNLKPKFLDLENAIRHSLKAFGMRFKGCGRGGFAQAVREACAGDGLVTELIDAMLSARRALEGVLPAARPRRQIGRGPRAVPALHADPWRRTGGSPELHDRDRRSRALQAVARRGGLFWLTSWRWQSGSSIDVQGRISKAGDADVRRALYEAASALLTRFKRKEQGQNLEACDRQAHEPPQGDRGCRP
jgi:transposase